MTGGGMSERPFGEGRHLTLRSDGLDWVDVEGEIVVLDTDRSIYLAPNPSGALLWRMLIDGTTHQEMVTALVTTFGVTSERAERDVDAFLDRLEDLGLLG